MPDEFKKEEEEDQSLIVSGSSSSGTLSFYNVSYFTSHSCHVSSLTSRLGEKSYLSFCCLYENHHSDYFYTSKAKCMKTETYPITSSSLRPDVFLAQHRNTPWNVGQPSSSLSQ